MALRSKFLFFLLILLMEDVFVASAPPSTSQDSQAATEQSSGERLVRIYPIEREQYEAILKMTNGKKYISEARLINRFSSSIDSFTRDVSSGWNALLRTLGFSTVEYSAKMDTKSDGVPVCAIKSPEYEYGRKNSVNARSSDDADVINCFVVLKEPQYNEPLPPAYDDYDAPHFGRNPYGPNYYDQQYYDQQYYDQQFYDPPISRPSTQNKKTNNKKNSIEHYIQQIPSEEHQQIENEDINPYDNDRDGANLNYDAEVTLESPTYDPEQDSSVENTNESNSQNYYTKQHPFEQQSNKIEDPQINRKNPNTKSSLASTNQKKQAKQTQITRPYHDENNLRQLHFSYSGPIGGYNSYTAQFPQFSPQPSYNPFNTRQLPPYFYVPSYQQPYGLPPPPPPSFYYDDYIGEDDEDEDQEKDEEEEYPSNNY